MDYNGQEWNVDFGIKRLGTGTKPYTQGIGISNILVNIYAN